MNNKIINWDLYHQNYKCLGKSIMNSGGDPFIVLKDFENLLILLANNSIQITSKYIGSIQKEYTSSYEELSSDDAKILLNEISKSITPLS